MTIVVAPPPLEVTVCIVVNTCSDEVELVVGADVVEGAEVVDEVSELLAVLVVLVEVLDVVGKFSEVLVEVSEDEVKVPDVLVDVAEVIVGGSVSEVDVRSALLAGVSLVAAGMDVSATVVGSVDGTGACEGE